MAKIFVPGSIGNVGPGFDVLGLELTGFGDHFSGHLHEGPTKIEAITGANAEQIPTDAKSNCATIAADAFLQAAGEQRGIALTIDRNLPLAGGMGGSAAASVGGAYLAATLLGKTSDLKAIQTAALLGETAVAGAHLDNIAPSLYGGLCLVLGSEQIVEVEVKSQWAVSLVTPEVSMPTKESRAGLPTSWDQWVPQMANTAALVAAFTTGSHSLASQALVDFYAEPVRKKQIPNFESIRAAALAAGALACTISGGGPSMFALSKNLSEAEAITAAMAKAAGATRSQYSGVITKQGAHQA